jgi:hypothetical protein
MSRPFSSVLAGVSLGGLPQAAKREREAQRAVFEKVFFFIFY